jgi:sugar/nucleoside kinase (ribokinase family)
MKSLLAFGEALIDLLQDPANPGLYHRNAGGAPANVAVGFARLGGHAAFMGMLGKDGFGELPRPRWPSSRSMAENAASASIARRRPTC